MEPRSNDIHDAIDRYLDNASTVDETRELFDAIAKDATVRQDFQSASLMRDTFDQELATTMMPADLYGTIVEQARQQGTLPPVPSTAPSARFWLGMGTVGMLMLGGLAISVVPWQEAGQPERRTPSSITTSASETNTSEQVPPASPSSLAASVQGVPPSVPRHSRGMDTWSAGGRPPGYRTASTSGTRRLPSHHHNGGTAATSVHADMAEPDATDNGLGSTSNVHSDLRSVSYTAPATIVPPPVGIDEAVPQRYRALGALSFRSMPPITLRMVSVPVSAYSYRTGAQVNGSWAVEAEYRLNDIHAVGIGLHNDVMPMYVVGADGVERSEERMLWSGAHWRMTLPLDLVEGVRPWFQLAAGGSSRGAVVEPTVGVGTSFGAISVSLGASVQGFIYQGVDAVGTATRTSVRMEVGYRWE